MIKYILVSVILFINYACGQDLDPLGWSGVAVVADTTTNIYVVTTAATDTNDGLTYATAKKYLSSALSLVNAPSDSIFIDGDLPDSTITITKDCNIVAYNYADKPILDGSKQITGWNLLSSATADTVPNVIIGGSDESTYITALDFGIPSGVSGILKQIIVTGHSTLGSGELKIGIGQRNGNAVTVLDSTFGTLSGLTAGTKNYIPITNGRFLSTDTFRVVMAFNGVGKFNKGLSKPADTSFAWGTYGSSNYYANWTSSNHTVMDSATWNYAYRYGSPDSSSVGVILESQTGGTNIYYAIYPDTMYQVFFNDELGIVNSDKSLLDSARNYHYANDSLYIYAEVPTDTASIYGTVRDGILIQAKANVSGFEVKRARYGIKPSGSIDTLEISSNYLHNNVYGYVDSVNNDLFFHNNIVAQNVNNVKLHNKDTVYFYNNDLFSYIDPVANSNFQSTSSKLDIRNNFFWVDNNSNNLRIGTIDLAGNVINMDYNGYGCSFYGTVLDKFWEIEGTKYDSLNQFQSLTVWDDSSWEIRQHYASPYNSLGNVLKDAAYQYQTDFNPRVDSVVTSPLVNQGVNLSKVKKDYYNISVPQNATQDIGAIEYYVSPNPSAPFGLSASISTTDSSHLTWNYTSEPDLVSSIIYRNGAIIDTIPIGKSYYDHPSRSSTVTIPSVTQLQAVNVTETSATIVFYIKPGNDTTYYRVRYGIGSFTNYSPSSDSTIVFRFIPAVTTYKVRSLDSDGYLSDYSNEATLQYDSTVYVSVNLTGLTSGQNYIADVTGSNDAGWSNSNDINFTTSASPPSGTADYYVSADSAISTIAQVNALSLSYGDTVAFHSGESFTDNQLIVKNGVVYTNYGGNERAKIEIMPRTSTTSAIYGVGSHGVTIKNLEVIARSWADFNNSDTITVDNCYFHFANNDYDDYICNSGQPPLNFQGTSTYITIKNSIIIGAFNDTLTSSFDNLVGFAFSDYLLFENNYIANTPHVLLGTNNANYVIIRNNRFYNLYHHALNIQDQADYYLVENNYFERQGAGQDVTPDPNKNYTEYGSLYLNGGKIIFRNNVVRKSGVIWSVYPAYLSAMQMYGRINAYSRDDYSEYNRVYNNDFFDNYTVALTFVKSTGTGYVRQNKVFNNAFFKNGDPTLYSGADSVQVHFSNEDGSYFTTNYVTNNYFSNSGNNVFQYQGRLLWDANEYKSSEIWFESNIDGTTCVFEHPFDSLTTYTYWTPATSRGNIYDSLNVLFKPKSPLIDAGREIANVVSDGNLTDNILTVDDPYPFFDGFGWVQGDSIAVIHLGTPTYARINSINRGASTLTLNQSITVSAGDDIYIVHPIRGTIYNDTKLDIGAFE